MSLEGVIQSKALMFVRRGLRKVAPGLFPYASYSGNRSSKRARCANFTARWTALCAWKKSGKPENIVGRDYIFFCRRDSTRCAIINAQNAYNFQLISASSRALVNQFVPCIATRLVRRARWWRKRYSRSLYCVCINCKANRCVNWLKT